MSHGSITSPSTCPRCDEMARQLDNLNEQLCFLRNQNSVLTKMVENFKNQYLRLRRASARMTPSIPSDPLAEDRFESPFLFHTTCHTQEAFNTFDGAPVIVRRELAQEITTEKLQTHFQIQHHNLLPFIGYVEIHNINYLVHHQYTCYLREHVDSGSLASTFNLYRQLSATASVLQYLHNQRKYIGYLNPDCFVWMDQKGTMLDIPAFDGTSNAWFPNHINYASARVLSGRRATYACDVYSFALIVLHFLGNWTPWEGLDHEDIRNAMQQGERPEILALSVESPLKELLYLAIRTNCSPTMDQFVNAFEHLTKSPLPQFDYSAECTDQPSDFSDISEGRSLPSSFDWGEDSLLCI